LIFMYGITENGNTLR